MVAKKTAAPKKTAPAAKKATAERTAKKAAPKKKAAAPKKAATARKAAPSAKAATASGKTAAGRSTTPRKATTARKSAAAKQTGAKTVVAKKTVARTAAHTESPLPSARVPGEPAAPSDLVVRPGEDPWTAAEVAEARSDLQAESVRLRAEILTSEDAISGLMRDSGDGAGDDQADVGTKNISREHEMALANNAREMLRQSEHALERLDDGTYGRCESCGNPIGKARMQAFPRATLCVECKQRTERR